jgi:hypothetical protein
MPILSEMQTVEKSIVNVDEGKPSSLINGEHLSTPSSSEQTPNGDSSLKNDSDVPPDPVAGILRSFNLSEEKLSHIQIAKVNVTIFNINFLNLEQH